MLRIALFLLASLFMFQAYAETSEEARKELAGTLSEIKASDKRQKEIEQKTAKLQKELKALQEEMVEMGQDTSKQETDLSAYEDKLSILEDQKKQKTAAFNARQAELSSMISTMVKLRRLPPEAIIAMPGKLDETLETARALGVITQAIEEESRSLKEQLRELDVLEDKIHNSRGTISSKKTILSGRQQALALKMKTRNALVEKLNGEQREERERIASLTEKSENLQDLVDTLQQEEAERKKKPETRKAEPSRKGRSFESFKGRIHMPAAGKVVSRYGNSEAGSAYSKGIIIETRAEAEVVAPFDGEVVFAGPFRDYGSIVIIRHGDDYHTMLAGLDEVDCKPGQNLLEGEPIGSMGESGSGTRLYLELREDGRTVDPIRWIKG